MAAAGSLPADLDPKEGAAATLAPWLDLNLGPGPDEVWDTTEAESGASASAGSMWTETACDDDPHDSSSSNSSDSGTPEPSTLRRRGKLPLFPERAGGAHMRPHSRCPSRRCRQSDRSMKERDIRSGDEETASFYSRKRRRDSEAHKLSEKRRRGRFNRNIKILQAIVPNSPKGDKLSILDGAIDHLKQLQAHQKMLEYLSVTSHAMALRQHVLAPAATMMMFLPHNPPVNTNIQAPYAVLHLPYFYL